MPYKIILYFMKELCLIKKHFSVCIEQKRENKRDIESKRKRARGREDEREGSTQFGGVGINRPSQRGRVWLTLELDKLFINVR